jgi:hypothetical protein
MMLWEYPDVYALWEYPEVCALRRMCGRVLKSKSLSTFAVLRFIGSTGVAHQGRLAFGSGRCSFFFPPEHSTVVKVNQPSTAPRLRRRLRVTRREVVVCLGVPEFN